MQCLSSRCVDLVASPGPGVTSDGGGGSASFDNVAACESLLDSLECAPAGGVELLDCNSLGASACDLADYFMCLADGASCQGGVLDVSGWGQCMDLAVCT